MSPILRAGGEERAEENELVRRAQVVFVAAFQLAPVVIAAKAAVLALVDAELPLMAAEFPVTFARKFGPALFEETTLAAVALVKVAVAWLLK